MRSFVYAHWEVDQDYAISGPGSAVYRDGPGFVQRFDRDPPDYGWVICALPGRAPVAVYNEIWSALQDAGSGSPEANPLNAVGFPVDLAEGTRIIDDEAVQFDLTGGSWGDGRLVRDATRWHWEPRARFSMNMTRAAGYWTALPVPRCLRLRAIASLPWADIGELALTSRRRRDLEQNLAGTELAAAVARLSSHRGADLVVEEWSRGPHPNSLHALSCSATVPAPDGAIALAACVMIKLPDASSSSVITCAEVRVESLDSWSAALAAASGEHSSSDLRLSTTELADALTASWQTATEILPAATTSDPGAMHWLAPPTVELRLTAEQPPDSTSEAYTTLDDYINLGPLGHSDRSPLREVAVTLTTPPLLDPHGRRSQCSQALTYMAQHFGYLDATEDQL
jgi:hypothetical protein